MNIKYFVIVLFFLSATIKAQENVDLVEENIAINAMIDGSLLSPKETTQTLAIIIADSGPTDRDGNQNFQKNNSLKKLAIGLAQNGIATFRYDKRTVKQIRRGNLDSDIVFNDFVTDANAIVHYFKSERPFDKIFIIGHGQGSLVGMLSSEQHVDGFISLAGSGKSFDDVLIKEIEKTAPMYKADSERVIALLKEGKTTSDYPQQLSSIFNESIQPFMSSWFQYKPTEVLSQLSIPILIVNGSKDLQVPIEEAESLHKASKNSKLVIIDNMNHVLFTIEGDDLENSKSYAETFRKVNPELLTTLTKFIKNPSK